MGWTKMTVTEDGWQVHEWVSTPASTIKAETVMMPQLPTAAAQIDAGDLVVQGEDGLYRPMTIKAQPACTRTYELSPVTHGSEGEWLLYSAPGPNEFRHKFASIDELIETVKRGLETEQHERRINTLSDRCGTLQSERDEARRERDAFELRALRAEKRR